MPVLLITCDSKNDATRSAITKSIKQYGNRAKLSDSSYAVVTSRAASDVHLALAGHLSGDGQRCVIHLNRPCAGHGREEVGGWLEKHLDW